MYKIYKQVNWFHFIWKISKISHFIHRCINSPDMAEGWTFYPCFTWPRISRPLNVSVPQPHTTLTQIFIIIFNWRSNDTQIVSVVPFIFKFLVWKFKWLVQRWRKMTQIVKISPTQNICKSMNYRVSIKYIGSFIMCSWIEFQGFSWIFLLFLQLKLTNNSVANSD